MAGFHWDRNFSVEKSRWVCVGSLRSGDWCGGDVRPVGAAVTSLLGARGNVTNLGTVQEGPLTEKKLLDVDGGTGISKLILSFLA